MDKLVTLEGEALEHLRRMLAQPGVYRVRVMQLQAPREGQVSVKVNEGGWTHPLASTL